jgi:alkylhydroperoxidase family enzyme
MTPATSLKGRTTMANPNLLLPLRSSHDTEGEVQRVLSKLESNGKSFAISRVMANSSHAFRPFIKLASALTHDSPLPRTDREVVILLLAARRNAEYEWREHVVMSARVGITDEQRTILAADDLTDLSTFTPSQQLALRIADEIDRSGRVDADAWSLAEQTWGTEAAFDLILAIGFWGGMVPILVKAVALEDPFAV